MNIPSQQNEMFYRQGAMAPFAELCNALYAEALRQLSQSQWPSDSALMQRRIGSLPGHVQRTAHALLFAAEQLLSVSASTAIRLDVHSGQWVAKQAQQNPARTAQRRQHAQPQAFISWLQRHAKLAMVLPVAIQQGLSEQLVLDSIDEIVADEQRLHLNQWGWFDYSGMPLTTTATATPDMQVQRLLQPSAALMRAACAGHRWGPSGKLAPQPLTLRSLLLTSTLQWPHFRGIQKPPF